MLTMEEFDDLQVGDEVEGVAIFPALTDEVAMLRTAEIDGDKKVFVVTYLGITLGRWTAQKNQGGIQWDVSVNSVRLYALADLLGISLEIDPNDRGRSPASAKARSTSASCRSLSRCKVVSSPPRKAMPTCCMLRSTGNLVLLAIATPEKGWEKVTIHMLNLAKMTDKPNQLFEKTMHAADTPDGVLAKHVLWRHRRKLRQDQLAYLGTSALTATEARMWH